MEKSTNLSQESSLESNQASTLDKPAQPIVGGMQGPHIPPPVALTAEEVAFIASQKAAMGASRTPAEVAARNEEAEHAPQASKGAKKAGKAAKWEK